jgi:uridine kinase
MIIGIDGKSGAGKSTLAAKFKEKYSRYHNMEISIIAMDDFFLQPFQRTPERLSQIGGNIDYERFEMQVVRNMKSNVPFQYRRYDCHKGELTDFITVNPNSLVIVEGVYSLHPLFSNMYDVSVFLDIDEKEQLRRLKRRNPDLLARFVNEWLPMENKYFDFFRIRENCDIKGIKNENCK